MRPGLTSIIIPTFNNQDVFLQCLRSLLSFTNSDIEIWVVLNGQEYDIQTEFPEVYFVKAPSNLGWMGGINYVKDRVNGEYVLFLNDDTQILDYDDQWLEKLKRPFKG